LHFGEGRAKLLGREPAFRSVARRIEAGIVPANSIRFSERKE
jgi:hypothetical protein